MKGFIRFSAVVAFVTAAGTSPVHADVSWGKVARTLGIEGTMQPGNVYRLDLPRTDIKLTIDGLELRPTFAPRSWLGFIEVREGVAVLGELVLLPEEVNPVVKRLTEGAVDVTAIHVDLPRARPSPISVHVAAYGEPAKLAGALRAALSLTATPLGPTPSPAQRSEKIELDMTALDKALGFKGKAGNGIYRYSIPRAALVSELGTDLPQAMGSANVISFQPAGGGRTAITGNFVLTANEVNPALKALRQGGIEVTALHNRMLTDRPRLFFLHFWAVDEPAKLARALRSTLDKVNVASE